MNYIPADTFWMRYAAESIETYIDLEAKFEFEWSQLKHKTGKYLPILLSSPTFIDAVHRTKEPNKKIKASLLNYGRRMATRTTPFALFAGISQVNWDQQTAVFIDSNKQKPIVRPNPALILSIIAWLEQQDDVWPHLQVTASPFIFFRGKQLYLAEQTILADRPQVIQTKIPSSPLLRTSIQEAQQAITIEDLVTNLQQLFPDVSSINLYEMINKLIKETVLETNLRPSLTNRDLLPNLITQLQSLPPCQTINQVLSMLQAISGITNSINSGAEPLSFKNYRQIQKAFLDLPSAQQFPPLHVELHASPSTISLSRELQGALVEGAQLLCEIAQPPQSYLTEYAYRFIEKYNPEQEIPILELLHDEYGLGSPYRTNPPQNYTLDSRRKKHLTQLAGQALYHRNHTIHLSEQDLSILRHSQPATPQQFDLQVQIAADSAQAIDQGEYTAVLQLNQHGVMNRFEQQNPSPLRSQPDVVPVDILFLPKTLNSFHLLHPPTKGEYTISVGIRSHLTHEIPLNELVIGVHNSKFYIRWPEKNLYIDPYCERPVSYRQTPDIVRFLLDIGKQGKRPPSPLDWGDLASLPYLPRLQYKQCVLSLARWSTRELESHLTKNKLAFFQACQEWRTLWQVPRYVLYPHEITGEPITLDLDSEWEVADLQKRLQREENEGYVLEAIPTPDKHWARGENGRHVVEFIIPFHSKTPSTHQHNLPQHRPRLSPSVIPPGHHWLYVSLYTTQSTQEKILKKFITHIVSLGFKHNLISSWFFIRYLDQNHHLRLRFHGPKHNLWEKFFQILINTFTKLIQEDLAESYTINTYIPEVERYGGEQALPLIETLFQIDSDTILQLIALDSKDPWMREKIAVLSLDSLAVGLGFSLEERFLIYQQFIPKQKTTPLYRQLKTHLRILLTQQNADSPASVICQTMQIKLHPIGEALRKLENDKVLTRSISQILLDLMHMHLNRFFGIDRQKERQILELLSRTVTGIYHAPLS